VAGRVPLAALALGTLVCLSACGASGPRREYTDEDQRLASKITLRASDLPPDWRADPATAGRSVPRHCYDTIWKHLVITGESAAGFFEGPKDFSRSPNYAASYVVVFVARGTAISSFIRLTKTRALRCLATDLKDHLLQGASIEHVSIRRRTPPGLGEHSAADEMTIEFGKSSSLPRGYVDAVFVQRDRVFALLLFGNITNPFDPVVERQLARVVATRMASS